MVNMTPEQPAQRTSEAILRATDLLRSLDIECGRYEASYPAMQHEAREARRCFARALRMIVFDTARLSGD